MNPINVSPLSSLGGHEHCYYRRTYVISQWTQSAWRPWREQPLKELSTIIILITEPNTWALFNLLFPQEVSKAYTRVLSGVQGYERWTVSITIKPSSEYSLPIKFGASGSSCITVALIRGCNLTRSQGLDDWCGASLLAKLDPQTGSPFWI